MDARKSLYETIFITHPELTEEEAEAAIQQIISLLEEGGAEILRTDRGGKRRLAYLIQKQRYGYYTLMHFRAAPAALLALERTYRLNERMMRYMTIRIDKEEQLTGFSRFSEEEGRDDDRDDRRRGGRRGDGFSSEDRERRPARDDISLTDTETDEDEDEDADVLDDAESPMDAMDEEVSEETVG